MYNQEKEIYDLFEILCKSIAGRRHKDSLQSVTDYISRNCTRQVSMLAHDENAVVTQISNHISLNSNNPHDDVTLFMKLYDQLKECQTSARNRNRILIFFNCMANSNRRIISQKKLQEISMERFDFCSLMEPTSQTLLDEDDFQEGQTLTYSSSLSTVSTETSFCSTSLDLTNKVTFSTLPANDVTKELIHDVIYSFTGIQGKYLRKDMVSGAFKLNPIAKNLNTAQAGMLLRLSSLGYYHDQIKSFTNSKTGRCALGFMGQGFISALSSELTSFYGMIALLQHSSNCLTLMEIMVWAIDPLQRLQWLTMIGEACKEKKGGILVTTIYEFLSHGDPNVKALVRGLLIAVCEPLQELLLRWLLDGEIFDPNGEFFIECNPEAETNCSLGEKYCLRNSMLPKFISIEIANKILIIGRNINFLRENCEGKTTSLDGKDELKQFFKSEDGNIFSLSLPEDTKFQTIIDAVYLNISKKLLDVVMGKFKLLEHLKAMRKYLLLGQGDFVGALLENLKFKFDRPGEKLCRYDLPQILDTAIRSTNAQFDDPEILRNLEARLELQRDGETGWDDFSLHYTLHGPLSPIFEPCMETYQIFFKSLWKLKHIEYLLSVKIWRDQTWNAKQFASICNEMNPVMYRLYLHTSKMIHFIHQIKYYVLFEVIECVWSKFLRNIPNAKTLDDVLKMHNEFLETLKIRIFLDVCSENMEEAYECILRLETWQDKFFDFCFKELTARRIFYADQSDDVNGDKSLQRKEDFKIFEKSLKNFETSLKQLEADYDIGLQKFLYLLKTHNDHNLQLFGIRLDFNGYYKNVELSRQQPQKNTNY